jgi:hypothetical protein
MNGRDKTTALYYFENIFICISMKYHFLFVTLKDNFNMKTKHFVKWCSHHTLNRAVEGQALFVNYTVFFEYRY